MKKVKGKLYACPTCAWGGIVVKGTAVPHCPKHGELLVKASAPEKSGPLNPIKASKRM